MPLPILHKQLAGMDLVVFVSVDEGGDGPLELIDLVGVLPSEVIVLTSEVAVRSRLRVDRTQQVELVHNRGRTQIEHLAHGFRICSRVTPSASVP